MANKVVVIRVMLTVTALACLLSHDGAVTAFSPRSVSHGSSHRRVSSSSGRPQSPFVTVVLEAKKKRRRKENANTDPLQEADDDLPDFDLKEDQDVVDASPPVARQRKRPTTMNSLETEVTPAMMATSSSTTNSSPRSIRDLISDRSLESKFDFEGEVAPEEAPADLPDLLQIARETESTGTVGKKKARQQARRAAALAAKAEEEQQNPLAQLSFLTNEEGKVVPTKILEAGAWAGIGLLVLWEFYINSPLFDRAAPMAPVVY